MPQIPDSIFKRPNSVIASQRVGAKRRPMTGSAKQPIGQQKKAGLLFLAPPREAVGSRDVITLFRRLADLFLS
ncbi:MAG: hypothetical protein WCA28_06315, partial [Bradyrhizobium sp.]